MKVRNALLTAVAGLALTGAATEASAQYRYRDGYARDGYTREYRGGRDFRAQQIVREAYRDVLRREPDRTGMREYTDAIVHRGWSENDVRRALRRSPEYAQKFGRGSYYRRGR